MEEARGRLRTAGLLKAKRPLSHEEIFRELPPRALDRVSLYRALDSFVEAGIVHGAHLDEGRRYYEMGDRCTPVQCHPHFTCRRCGETTCVEEARIPLVRGLPRGFRVERQKVHIDGLCAQCAGRQDREETRR
jgi:Fur family ferric uptake transcriptional regulator